LASPSVASNCRRDPGRREVKLTPRQRNSRAQALIAKIQECESECHAIGFTRSAHAVNAAKNAIGWDYDDAISRAALEQHKEK
jgi:hypothetical protein